MTLFSFIFSNSLFFIDKRVNTAFTHFLIATLKHQCYPLEEIPHKCCNANSINFAYFVPRNEIELFIYDCKFRN
jgi:hypothetical protein